MKLLNDVIEKLCRGEQFDDNCQNHTLSGTWAGCWECHIKGTWVLLYQIEDEYVILRRTESHSDVY